MTPVTTRDADRRSVLHRWPGDLDGGGPHEAGVAGDDEQGDEQNDERQRVREPREPRHVEDVLLRHVRRDADEQGPEEGERDAGEGADGGGSERLHDQEGQPDLSTPMNST